VVTAEALAARAEVVRGSADLRALLAHLRERARPVLDRMPIVPDHKALLSTDGGLCPDDGTALTNLMTGRPARGFYNRVMRDVGPMAEVAPEFPLAAVALAPLRAKAEAQGSGDFSPMWAGQAAALGRALPAGELTRMLAAEALERMRALGIASPPA